MAYIFRKERDPSNPYDVSTVEFQVDGMLTLPELLEEFGHFLRGCSFALDGEVTVVDEDDEPAREYVTLARVQAALQRIRPEKMGFVCLPATFADVLHRELNLLDKEGA